MEACFVVAIVFVVCPHTTGRITRHTTVLLDNNTARV